MWFNQNASNVTLTDVRGRKTGAGKILKGRAGGEGLPRQRSVFGACRLRQTHRETAWATFTLLYTISVILTSD